MADIILIFIAVAAVIFIIVVAIQPSDFRVTKRLPDQYEFPKKHLL